MKKIKKKKKKLKNKEIFINVDEKNHFTLTNKVITF